MVHLNEEKNLTNISIMVGYGAKGENQTYFYYEAHSEKSIRDAVKE